MSRPTPPSEDRIESIDWAGRWINDAFRVIDPAGGFGALDIDVSAAQRLVAGLRARGVPAALNHVFVRAAALALARNPEIHVLVAGTRRLRPGRVDIGLSVSGTTNVAPVMLIEDAGRKPLPVLCAEITRRIRDVRRQELRDLARLRRLGWMIPFAWLRRWILRALLANIGFRRRISGTFQISCAPVDVVVPLLFNTAALLGVGRVRDRVVALGGAPVVRPIVTIACAIDHKAWDGTSGATFVSEMQRIIEGGELDQEAAAPPA